MRHLKHLKKTRELRGYTYHCLLPFKTKHFLLESYTARVAMPAGSLPKFGSVSPKQPTISPEANSKIKVDVKSLHSPQQSLTQNTRENTG